MNTPASSTSQKSKATSTGNTNSQNYAKWAIAAGIILLVMFMLFPQCSRADNSSDGVDTPKAEQVSAPKTYDSLRGEIEQMSQDELAKDMGMMVFGSYPEGADGTRKPLYWYVNAVTDDYAEFACAFAIDWMPYNASGESCTWQDSSLREWLNGEFLETAFTADERFMLVPFTTGNQEDMVSLFTPEGADTALLSIARFPTPYAISRGASEEWEIVDKNQNPIAEGCTDWWLRDDEPCEWAPSIYGVGSYEKTDVDQSCGVVPVIRIAG